MKSGVFTMRGVLYRRYKSYHTNVRLFAELGNSDSFNNSSKYEEKNVKPFKDIPGPRGIFGIGTLYKYFPLIGEFIIF